MHQNSCSQDHTSSVHQIDCVQSTMGQTHTHLLESVIAVGPAKGVHETLPPVQLQHTIAHVLHEVPGATSTSHTVESGRFKLLGVSCFPQDTEAYTSHQSETLRSQLEDIYIWRVAWVTRDGSWKPVGSHLQPKRNSTPVVIGGNKDTGIVCKPACLLHTPCLSNRNNSSVLGTHTLQPRPQHPHLESFINMIP